MMYKSTQHTRSKFIVIDHPVSILITASNYLIHALAIQHSRSAIYINSYLLWNN